MTELLRDGTETLLRPITFNLPESCMKNWLLPVQLCMACFRGLLLHVVCTKIPRRVIMAIGVVIKISAVAVEKEWLATMRLVIVVLNLYCMAV